MILYHIFAFILTVYVHEMCLEERVFYRIISGLHAAIGAHISERYPVSQTDETLAPSLAVCVGIALLRALI